MDTTRYNKIVDSAKRLFSTRYDLLLLTLLEKLSRIIGLILLVFVGALALFAAFAFATIALAFVLSKWLPMWAACLIVAALFIVILVLAVVFKKQLFINPIVSALSGIIFSSDNMTRSTAIVATHLADEEGKEDRHE